MLNFNSSIHAFYGKLSFSCINYYHESYRFIDINLHIFKTHGIQYIKETHIHIM